MVLTTIFLRLVFLLRRKEKTMNKGRFGLFLIPICVACLVGCNKSVKELPLHFESIGNNDSYQIETYIRYHFDDNDTIVESPL